jgi:hypothetical protein
MSTPANKITHETAHAPEPERYEFREAPIHHFGLDRRDFFKFFGAGIMVFAAANDALALQESGGGTRQNHSDELPKEITAWLHIAEDGKVTVFTGKVESGTKHPHFASPKCRRRIACVPYRKHSHW